MRDEFFRQYCLELHVKSVREGDFLAARNFLRRALKFRKGGREASIAVGYCFCNGKLIWCRWGN